MLKYYLAKSGNSHVPFQQFIRALSQTKLGVETVMVRTRFGDLCSKNLISATQKCIIVYTKSFCILKSK